MVVAGVLTLALPAGLALLCDAPWLLLLLLLLATLLIVLVTLVVLCDAVVWFPLLLFPGVEEIRIASCCCARLFAWFSTAAATDATVANDNVGAPPGDLPPLFPS